MVHQARQLVAAEDAVSRQLRRSKAGVPNRAKTLRPVLLAFQM
jgi:hypothetical protein